MTASRSAEPVLTEIKVWMARRRINQSELAAKLGVQQSWVSKRLAGKVALTVGDLAAVADVLDVPASEFFRPVALDKARTRDSVQNRYTVASSGIAPAVPFRVAS